MFQLERTRPREFSRVSNFLLYSGWVNVEHEPKCNQRGKQELNRGFEDNIYNFIFLLRAMRNYEMTFNKGIF